jgi:hypothetical protein
MTDDDYQPPGLCVRSQYPEHEDVGQAVAPARPPDLVWRPAYPCRRVVS